MLIVEPFQVSTGVRALGFGDFFGWALSDDFSSTLATFRAKVDHPIRSGDQVQVVFDDQHRVAGIDQPLDDSDQPPHVRHVQADGWFLENEQIFFILCFESRAVAQAAQ